MFACLTELCGICNRYCHNPNVSVNTTQETITTQLCAKEELRCKQFVSQLYVQGGIWLEAENVRAQWDCNRGEYITKTVLKLMI